MNTIQNTFRPSAAPVTRSASPTHATPRTAVTICKGQTWRGPDGRQYLVDYAKGDLVDLIPIHPDGKRRFAELPKVKSKEVLQSVYWQKVSDARPWYDNLNPIGWVALILIFWAVAVLLCNV